MSADSEMDDIVEEFLAESSELLVVVESVLVAAEHGAPPDSDIAAVFRALHTVKGTAAFLGYPHVTALAHDAEHLLTKIRDHELPLDEPRITVLIESVDALRNMLAIVEATGNDGEDMWGALLQQLTALTHENGTHTDAHAPAATPAAPAAPAPQPEVAPAVETANEQTEQPATPEAPAAPAKRTTAAHIPAKKSVGETPTAPTETAEKAANPDTTAPEMDAQHVETAAPQTAQAAPAAAPTPAAPAAGGGAGAAAAAEATSIRVDVGVLDRLIDLVGELVLARNQLVAAGVDLGTAGQRLNHVVTELQEGIMRTRMQPVATLLAKSPRIARDAAQSVGRRVRVEIDAGDTELDRSVLEAIRDPLTHLLRNAVDHGIERPAERSDVGKNPSGLVTVRAWHESGHVVVEVRDDGRGIDPAKVKAKAVERGLIEAQAAEYLTEREVHQLLMLPGFSTAEAVTSVSGRGVGMDVVRANIERIGGTVEVESVLGQGTAWKLRIPLTLAILPVLVVDVGPHRLAVPASSLREALRIPAEEVEMLGGRRWLRLRGALLPLVDVGAVLEEGHGAGNKERLRVVVVGDGSQRIGLVVDEIADPAEIVVKPLGSLLSGVAELSGATVMGDGRIAYILDVTRLAARDGLDGGAVGAQDRTDDIEVVIHHSQDVIVARRGQQRLAFPVDIVARLERFDSGAFEYTQDRCVVQYRGTLLPVVAPDPSGNVVVCHRDGNMIGVGVEYIDDVADVQVDEDGTVVVDGKVADRVKVEELWV